jgi:hypothetical protein
VWVPPNGLESELSLQLWDNIALTEWEEDVLEALRLMVPDMERFGAAGSPDGGGAFSSGFSSAFATGRSFRIKVPSRSQPLPLRSLGDGPNRVLGLALALVNARDGFLFLDEVENGIHYSLQPDLWRLIFRVAQRMNVQVFATTHSYDCVTAFQEAAAENPEEGILIRLEERQGSVTVTLFDERELSVVADEAIEVR